MNEKKNILVYANWESNKEPVPMGTLSAIQTRGKEIFSFEYHKDWLNSKYTLVLDPDLQFFSGPQYVREEKANFGLFLDSCPDRWGRVLMDRREEILARKNNTKAKRLFESDYLLGVFDEHRMGGLRFKLHEKESFLNDDKEMGVPPWTSLRELEDASLKFEQDNLEDKDSLRWINLLIAPGSSLGGARPKASVLDPHKQLWIAKFPSVNDKKDVGAWEMVANVLATESGINISEGKIEQFNNKYHTFLTKRFDRKENRERIHFSSAMTMLGQIDGANHSVGISYLNIVEFLTKNGSEINSDLEELWRRIVFNILIKNTDDHLRNHGFILSGNGWRLSPAFDVNPIEYGTGLSLNISEKDNSLDIDLAMSVREYFRLDEKRALGIISKSREVVNSWRAIAQNFGINRAEQDRMSTAFE